MSCENCNVKNLPTFDKKLCEKCENNPNPPSLPLKEEVKEMIIWLLLNYRSNFDKLNANGFSVLLDLNDNWNLERADKVFKQFCEEE